MKIVSVSGFIISLLIVTIAGVLLLFTNVWYLVLLSGLVASIVVRKGYLVSALSGFVGGIAGILIIFLTLPLNNLGSLMSEVGAIAGISSVILMALMFLINGGLCLSGALIGTFITRVVKRSQ